MLRLVDPGGSRCSEHRGASALLVSENAVGTSVRKSGPRRDRTAGTLLINKRPNTTVPSRPRQTVRLTCRFIHERPICRMAAALCGAGLITFPVQPDKTPAIRGYLKIGPAVSRQLAIKFPANDAFGLACKRNRITVLDVDTRDERVLIEGLASTDRHPSSCGAAAATFRLGTGTTESGGRFAQTQEGPSTSLGMALSCARPHRPPRGDTRSFREAWRISIACQPCAHLGSPQSPSDSNPSHPTSPARSGTMGCFGNA